jgi:CheY-like chemotaxis protein
VKILIVDDSEATLEIVKRALEKFDYRKLLIKKANNAKVALQYISSWNPDIVLTDWHMPDMSGLTLLHVIKQRQLNITVAMITTVDVQDQIDRAFDAGASFVLSKPFTDVQLHEHILPLVQNAEEDEIILDDVDVNEELALPKLSLLERLIHKHVDDSLCIKPIHAQQFDETKVPCLMAVYVDRETQKVKAVGIIDVYAACVMASGIRVISNEEAQQAIHQNLVTSEILEASKEALSATAYAFLDKKTKMSLRIKTVKFIASPFRKLEILFQTQADSRIDFSCQRDGMALGKVLLVGF